MTQSLLDRQLATITDILRECGRRGADQPGLANKRVKVTPTECNEGLRNAAYVTVRAACQNSERTISVSPSKGMHTTQHVLPSSRDAENVDDPRQMLRELERDSQERRARKGHHGFEDSKHVDMPGSVAAANQHDAVRENPKEMLQELHQRYWAAKTLGTDHNETDDLTGSEAILTDIKKERQALGVDAYQGTESDLETVFERPRTTHSPFHPLAPQHTLRTSGTMPASDAAMTTCPRSGPPMTDALDTETIPYAVALLLESAGCKWEEVMGWTLYLFSSGMDEYRTEKESEQKAQEKEKLDAIMARVLADEEKRREVEKRPFAGRLILSNLAADVDPKSIYQFFFKYQRDIRGITLLLERDPVKRTRTAYVDMSSRTAAVCASFEFGYIFGLKVESKLAVE